MKQRTYRAVHFFEKTGALHNANTVKSQPENYSHFGPLKHTIESSLDKTITSVERVIAIKMRMNAQTARKTYWDACLAWMTKTLVKGDLQFNMVRWESNEDALENILGTTATGPWRNDGAINTCGTHRMADKVQRCCMRHKHRCWAAPNSSLLTQVRLSVCVPCYAVKCAGTESC